MWLNLTGQRYIDEVHVRLFRGAVGDKFVFMDDNATCHRTPANSTSRMASAFSRSKPHFKCVGCFGRQVAGRNYPPTNKNTFIRSDRGMG
ncbi:hypothetical protein TNCV_1117861 [Trichonephila clavipes]|nr:hypothetical protein TNCV_1117861 [Trichonephila clavipes]